MKNNFNSAVCTSIEQSRKLLPLGLKKGTADCAYLQTFGDKPMFLNGNPYANTEEWAIDKEVWSIPAWSLHRLLSMLPRYVQKEYTNYGRKYIAALDLLIENDLCVGYKEGVDEPCYDKIFYANDIYTSICDCIEWLIKEGYFNKEYLEK